MKRLFTFDFMVLLLSITLLNQVAWKWDFGFDLTEEKKYTISKPTIKLLQSIPHDISIQVFLDGDLPPNFERLKKATNDILNRFVKESSGKVNFQIINPLIASSTSARNRYIQSVIEKGVEPSSLTYVKDGEKTQKMIFPGALVINNEIEVPINFLTASGSFSSNPETILNSSVELLEYHFAQGIAQAIGQKRKKIGYLSTHSSVDTSETIAFREAILSKYDLYDVNLSARNTLDGYEAVIIAKPTKAFTEHDKFLLDQYLMKGGSLLFCVDMLRVNMDSALGDGTIAIPYEHNLRDMLFKYGVRINNDFVLDANHGQFPVVVGNLGDQPQIQMIPWPFFPVVSTFSDHPAVKNLGAIELRFASTIDSVKAKGVEKYPLLFTSNKTKVLGPPVRVAFNDLKTDLSPDIFHDQKKVLGYSLKGTFTSLYTNRLHPLKGDNFKGESNGGKVIVISDGDLIRNSFDPKNQTPLELGVEPFSKVKYGNKTFLMNLIDYLVDQDDLMETRTRQIKVRPLEKVKITQGRSYWQVVNLCFPAVLIILLGVTKIWIRRKNNLA